jgi:hypothetical protein
MPRGLWFVIILLALQIIPVLIKKFGKDEDEETQQKQKMEEARRGRGDACAGGADAPAADAAAGHRPADTGPPHGIGRRAAHRTWWTSGRRRDVGVRQDGRATAAATGGTPPASAGPHAGAADIASVDADTGHAATDLPGATARRACARSTQRTPQGRMPVTPKKPSTVRAVQAKPKEAAKKRRASSTTPSGLQSRMRSSQTSREPAPVKAIGPAIGEAAPAKQPVVQRTAGLRIAAMLMDRKALKQAIILKELLDQPVSLREQHTIG